MKQKDILTIVVIGIFSGVVSLVLSSLLITTPENQSQEVEQVAPITAEFGTPDPRYFNEDAINPANPITIGDQDNETPLND